MLQSGATLELSQQNSIVAAWMESLADSPARILASQASKPESTASTPVFGSNISESFAKCNPDGSLLKMSPQSSLFPQEELYLEGLPKSGSMRNGYLFERPTLGLRTEEIGPSFWPTSRGSDGEKGGPNQSGSKGDLMLPGAAAQWPNPTAQDSSRGVGTIRPHDTGIPLNQRVAQVTENWGTPRVTENQGHGRDRGNNRGRLEDQIHANWLTPHGMNGKDHTGKEGRGGEFAKQATEWMTPCVPNGGRSVSEEVVASKRSTADGKRQVGLESQTRFWATPNAHDGRRPGVDEHSTQGGNLQRDAAKWGTPTSRDYKDGSSKDADCPTNGLLGRQAIRNWPTPDASVMNDGNGAGMPLAVATLTFPSSRPDPDPAQPNSGKTCWCGGPNCGLPSHRRKLNPLFATWMMGWPIWWLTRVPMPYARQEMALWLYRQRLHLRFFLEGLDY